MNVCVLISGIPVLFHLLSRSCTLVFVCVYLGVWVHLCMYGRLCVCMYVGPEGNFRCLSSGLSTFLLFLLWGVFCCLEGLILVWNLPSKLGCQISVSPVIHPSLPP